MLDEESFHENPDNDEPAQHEEGLSGIIERAQKSDINGILEVQNQHLIDSDILHKENISSEIIDKYSRSGFLVYPFSSSELKDVIENEDITLLVEKNKGEVAAYVAVYDLDEWLNQKPAWYEKVNFSNKETEAFIKNNKIIYLRHAARRDDIPSDMSTLVQRLLNEGGERGAKGCVGEILNQPIPNKISSGFFTKKAGFEKVGEVNDGDLLWDLVLRKI